jgi:hypothetical protein
MPSAHRALFLASLALWSCGAPARPAAPAVVTATEKAHNHNVEGAKTMVLRPNPETGTLQGSPTEAIWHGRIDARGMRGKLVLPETFSPSQSFEVDFALYGESAKKGKARVLRVGREALVLGGFEAGTGSFVAAEGNDEALWDGIPAFDPRMVFGEFAGTRTSFRERLKENLSIESYVFLLGTDPSLPVSGFHVDAVSNALLLTLNPEEPYGARIRIALASTLVKQLLLAAHARSGKARREASALQEAALSGTVRGYARDVLRQFGTLDANEVSLDVSALLSTLWHSPDAATRSALLADLSMFFTFITQAQGVSRAYEGAHANTAQNGLDTLSINAIALSLPATAPELTSRILSMQHPCFRFASQRELNDDASFGLNLASTRAAGQIVGLVADGPLARAGLHEGDKVKVGKPYTEGKSRVLEVVVADDRKVVLTERAAAMTVPAVFANPAADPKRCRRETP